MIALTPDDQIIAQYLERYPDEEPDLTSAGLAGAPWDFVGRAVLCDRVGRAWQVRHTSGRFWQFPTAPSPTARSAGVVAESILLSSLGRAGFGSLPAPDSILVDVRIPQVDQRCEMYFAFIAPPDEVLDLAGRRVARWIPYDMLSYRRLGIKLAQAA